MTDNRRVTKVIRAVNKRMIKRGKQKIGIELLVTSIGLLFRH